LDHIKEYIDFNDYEVIENHNYIDEFLNSKYMSDERFIKRHQDEYSIVVFVNNEINEVSKFINNLILKRRILHFDKYDPIFLIIRRNKNNSLDIYYTNNYKYVRDTYRYYFDIFKGVLVGPNY